ncbi:hypothetical protein [Marilutibacter alkalisoli]|uniref:Uncharacterized protein n=1 Tax=Marilutibacter alkalisoli TaxID=2591633 RepID=A0A514BVR5_9GAMM|nr:hypothetical protein [Lysobacter alkalisoli]QDH71457.1 hypothetical protein FKV23_16165 [Lysobacter alkalisoli]
MHTILMVIAGLAVLGLFLLIGRLWALRVPGATRRAALWFMPIWLVAALVNMGVGVIEAGYSVSEELPFLLMVFGIPALVAGYVWWRLRPRKNPNPLP